ncbi:MAG TPA: class I SAM-dependent methyltransferase [Thermoanaerobaculia bacterium]
MIPFVDPASGELLHLTGDRWIRPSDGNTVATMETNIARFVDPKQNYAESFGYQWKRWHSIRSDARNPGYGLRDVIFERTHFAEFELEGKSILECGMGGGDDTEILLSLPFSEIHSFDLSTSVERAVAFLIDPRLSVFQASIFDIPLPDLSFDIVYCHRVLQHTPDPVTALKRICAKVKPGGLLFAHAYRRSRLHMAEWRYKYRPITKRLPWRAVAAYLDSLGPALHRLNRLLYKRGVTRALAYRFVPFYHIPSGGEGSSTSTASILELEKQITFDALTPWYDQPMDSVEFRQTIEQQGFEILHFHANDPSPVYCTAVRRSAPAKPAESQSR